FPYPTLFRSSESDQIGEIGMGAKAQIMRARQLDRLNYRRCVTCMPATGDVDRGYERREFFIRPHDPPAETLATIGVQIDTQDRVIHHLSSLGAHRAPQLRV